MKRSPAEKMPLVRPVMNRFQEGFVSLAGFTREFWRPGGMLYRRERSSDRYLVTRHPDTPIPVARLAPAAGRSTRVDLFMPTINRQIFKRACNDHQIVLWRWSTASNGLILSMSNAEAYEVGVVVADLYKRGKLVP